jgi:hypothetical protein
MLVHRCGGLVLSGRWQTLEEAFDIMPDIFIERTDAGGLAKRDERTRLTEWFAAQSGPVWGMAQALWEDLTRRLPALPLPAVGRGEDERAQLAWSRPGLYVEIEVDERGALSWYARDTRTRKSEAGEGLGFELTPALTGWLERVTDE